MEGFRGPVESGEIRLKDGTIIRGLASDNDGCKHDTEPPSKLAWLTAMITVARFLKRGDWETFLLSKPRVLLEFNGRNRADREKLCLDWFGSDFPFELCFGARSAALDAHLWTYGVAPKCGARRFSRWFAERVPCIIVTSSESKRVEAMCKQSGIHCCFPQIIGGEHVTHGKPHEEPYLMAAERLGIDPQHLLVPEDSSAGIESAHRAGAIPLLIPDMVAPTEDDIERARYHFLSLEEALAFFQANVVA